ncbi:hypothetical protein ABH920_003799 [Catenulispora sp. EB89]|uniref:hypothetical protein n=1 Tax=Catenulispora sp. EB89 TaxID=3156257 RepID=UPI003512D0AC
MRRKRLAAVGTCLSVLALPFVLALRTRRRRRAASAVVIILSSGLVAPVSVRTSRIRGVPTLLTVEAEPPTRQEPEASSPHWNVSELSNHSFPEAYLAIVSMMQSLAVGFLADRMITGRVVGPMQGIGYAICTMMVIAVWQDYLSGSTICRWFPSLLDASIPAALGLTECFLIVSVSSGTKVFLFRLGLFLVVGAIAYLNWFLRARRHKGDPGKKKAYEFLRPYILFGCIACPVASLSAFVLAGLYTPADNVSDMVLVLVLVLPMFLQSVITWSLRRFLWQLSEDQSERKHRKPK